MITKKIKRKIHFICERRKYGNLEKSTNVINEYRIIGKKNIFLEKNVTILDNARIEAITNWNKNEYKPRVEIGENTSFQQDLHLICANKVKIGKDCVFSARVFITDLNHEYRDINTSVMFQDLIVSDICIEDGCFIGMGVSILPGVHLGKHCVVGANSVVTKSFPDYTVIAGNPAIAIKRFNLATLAWEKTDSLGFFVK